MPASDYLIGLLWLLATVLPALGIAGLLTARRLRHLTGSERALGFAVLALGMLMLVELVPLALGVLTRGTPVLAGVLGLVAVHLLVRAAPATPAPPPEPSPSSRLSWALAAAGAVGALAFGLGYALTSVASEFTATDTVSFHLPNVIGWMQTGSVWQVDQFLPYAAQGNYPNSGDLLSLVAILPWRNDFAVRYVTLPSLAVMALAVYVLARELRGPRATAVLLAALMVSLPIVALAAYYAELPDSVMFATFTAGVTFLVRHHRTGLRADLVMGGIGLGIAFGVKWYGVTAAAVVIAVWFLAHLAAGTRVRRALGDVARIAGLILLCGGFWLVRNLVESSNPFFPAKVKLLGVTLFDAPVDRLREIAGAPISSYFGQAGVLRHYVAPGLVAGWGEATIAVLGVILVVGAVAALRDGTGRRDGVVLALVTAAALVLVVYAYTPYSALGTQGRPTSVQYNTRYGLPALLLAAGVAGAVARRLGRRSYIVDLTLVVAFIDAARRWVGNERARDLVLAVVIVAIGAGAAVLGRRHPDALLARVPARGRGVGGGLAVSAAAIVAWGVVAFPFERRFNAARYRSDGAAVATVATTPPVRVGLVGQWSVPGLYPILPAFGPRLANRVEAVGPVVEGMLMEYTERDSFAAALRRGHYDLLLVGTATPPLGIRPSLPREQEAWIRAAGYRIVAADTRTLLFRPRGPDDR